MPKLNRLLCPLAAAAILAVSARADHEPGRGMVRVEGFAPPGVTQWTVQAEYVKIWRTLAPKRRLSRGQLTVRYCPRRLCGDSGAGLPPWGIGGAVGSGLVVILTDVSPLLGQSFQQVTTHEIVHIVLERAYPHLDLPRWFHEGVAMLLSGDVSLEEQLILSRAILTGSALSLSSIDSVNSFGRAKAELAYSQSRRAAVFLVETYGIDVLGEILSSADSAGDFDKGVDNVLALAPGELESLVRQDLVRKYPVVFLLGDTYLLWIAIVVLFLAGVAVTVVRNRQRMRQAAAEEQSSAPQENAGGAAPDGETGAPPREP